ncbi:WcbI family polysaccharide biosynthesis putative acetyltransferase [Methylocystis sp. 9N]|uniref:WcbI family polysaccharide biosynthesis putative acetyltransferase n=1 Tax=Methylocystis borbori TaxID=3118750 RepID=A0ABU7XK41_9HYPH
MKVAVIGNCQISGIVEALRHSGYVEAEPFSLAELRTAGRTETEAARLPSFDWIVIQNIEVIGLLPEYAPYRLSRLQDISPNVIVIPSLAFTGFHPDCTAIINASSKVIRTPAGDYSSALIVAAFMLGLPARRTERLFNAYVYQQLRYFDEANKAFSSLQEYSRRCGMDLSSSVTAWLNQGVSFMHTINHPVAFALEGLAKLIAARIGVPPSLIRLERDNLASNTIWPVYPELAERLKVQGSLLFKPAGAAGTISLGEMIEGCYEAYERASDSIQISPHIARTKAIIEKSLVSEYVTA